MNRTLSLIGYPCGKGAQITECEKGPEKLKDWGLSDKLNHRNIDSIWHDGFKLDNSLDDLQYVKTACNSLYKQVIDSIDNGNFPVTIGGDHSMAIGTWSAIADKYSIKNNLGLIWIDAHLDAHTPDSSQSGAIHGMPAASLLGYGSKELVNLGSEGAKINPEHLVYIGIRSYEEEEYQLIKDLGITVFTIYDVIKYGMENIIQDTISIVTENTNGFGLTVDLDAFDPTRAPGVGSPEKIGLLRNEVFLALKNIGNHKKIKALEIAEYNPDEGYDDITKNLVLDLISSIFSK